MVEAVDAAEAVIAVTAPRRADKPAVRAETCWAHRIKQRYEVHLWVALEVARITAGDY